MIDWHRSHYTPFLPSSANTITIDDYELLCSLLLRDVTALFLISSTPTMYAIQDGCWVHVAQATITPAPLSSELSPQHQSITNIEKDVSFPVRAVPVKVHERRMHGMYSGAACDTFCLRCLVVVLWCFVTVHSLYSVNDDDEKEVRTRWWWWLVVLLLLPPVGDGEYTLYYTLLPFGSSCLCPCPCS